MLPNLEIGGFTLQWYWLFQALALTVSLSFLICKLHTNVQTRRTGAYYAFLILALLVIGYAGARLLAVIDFFTFTGAFDDWKVFMMSFSMGGFRWYGTLLAVGLLVLVLLHRTRREDLAMAGDALGLCLCLLTAIVKNGCLFSGDGCYGLPTALPWGMEFPYGAAPTLLPVHPTPLYDSLFHFILFVILLKSLKRTKAPGLHFYLFLMSTSVFNVLLELIRTNPEVVWGLTLPQLTYILLFMIALIGFLSLQRKKSVVLHRYLKLSHKILRHEY